MGQFDPQSAVTLVDRDGREIPREQWLPVVAEFVRRLEVLGVDPVRRLPGEAGALVAAAVDQRVTLARLVDRYAAEARTAREVGNTARAVELERRRAEAQAALDRAGGPLGAADSGRY